MKKKVEILSPAGSYESFKAAIAAGADAVYIGGTRFGARAFADNLSEEKLLEVIDYAHIHGRKIYLTINTLLKENEIENQLYDYLVPYYRQGIDAVIVQDIGVLSFVKKHFPDLPIHASTQMTVTDLLGAKFLEKQGVERVVTSREMHIDEIKEISENTELEIESFVHGALCYCYSGQCLYSSLIGGRSGNRGQCAQPCRLPYKVNGDKNAKYVLSLKDICTLEYIPQLIESGIYSFKIEGRMKKPEYVALVTKMYRKYVDKYLNEGKENFCVDPKDKEKLMDLYNRGGSHSGYYFVQNGRDMISLDRPNHAGVPALKILNQKGRMVSAQAITELNAGDVIELPGAKENYTFAQGAKKGQRVSFQTHQSYRLYSGMILNRTRNEHLIKEIQDTIIDRKIKERINGDLILAEGSNSRLTLSCGEIVVDIEGECVQKAVNQPMDVSRIEKQMRKTGNTEFEFDRLEIDLQGEIFIPMQELNELRRRGIEQLKSAMVLQYRRCSEQRMQLNESKSKNNQVTKHFVYVEEMEQFETVVEKEWIKRIYIDANAIQNVWNNNTEEIIKWSHQKDKEIYLAYPHIFRKRTRELYEKYYEKFIKMNWDGVLIRNYESYEFLMSRGYQGKIVLDYNMYQMNGYAKRFWDEEGVESFTAPLELNHYELKELGLDNGELVIYGHLPMMVSAQCVTKGPPGGAG